ncbi:hypothetical protein MNV49_001132 [Pseudohyphozyma bogoriensis]|nr:hypothetical protein MNV49_001132 [Pseudohyphozyma bogoriensis]
MVFLPTLIIASSVALTSFTPGAQGAAIPLPLQHGVQRPIMHDNHARMGKRDLEWSPDYDEDHSQHWNFHHGLVNEDGHGHGPPHRRSDGPRRHERSYFDGNDLVDVEVDLAKRHSHERPSVAAPEKHLIDISVDKRHWDHHHHHHGGEDHVHIHNHKRVEVEPRSGHQKGKHHKSDRKKGSKSSKSMVKHKKGKGKKPSTEKAEDKMAKRADSTLAPAGVPGFIEVATQFFNSTLSRSIAGLVYSTNPDAANDTTPSFLLGTSTAQSTQFYLTSATSSAAPRLNVVNIRVPILDSLALTTSDYCATFDLAPPSPMSLRPCGDTKGFSQSFSYNSTTAELQPLYSDEPAPMALVDNASGTMETTTKPAAQNPESNTFAADDLDSTDDSTSTSTSTPAQTISLFFVPASTYYKAPVAMNELFAEPSDSSKSTSPVRLRLA